MPKTENPILSRLKEAVPQPTVAVPAQPRPEPPRAESLARHSASRIPQEGAMKLSVSLYGPDLKRLDEIKTYMQSRGHRNLSDSGALRLAGRAVQITDRFLEEYRQMLSEDGRRKQRSNTERK